MEGLSLKTVATDGNYWEASAHLLYLRSFIIMRIINTRDNLKCAWKNRLYSCNVKIIGINEIDKVSVSVYFVFGGQITYPMSVIAGGDMVERNVSLVFIGELNNGHYDVLFSAEEKEKLDDF
jgi:hypothetical protein